MAEWIELPAEPLLYQPHQVRMLEDRRKRICPTCKVEFSSAEHPHCPHCGKAGKRLFDRMTIIAGRRFGKSRIGSIMGVEEASLPNSVGWACAPTNPKLHRYVIPAFQKLIPREWVQSYNSEFKDLRLKNGALIHFQTLEDPDQGRGQGLDWLWIDEVCELSPAHWDVIRPSLAGDTVAFFTTSPRGYDWVYDDLYKPALDGVPGYWACHARTSESANPRISDDFLARERLQMSDTMFRQEYEADFVVFQGAIYGDLIDPQILHHDDAVRKLIPEWPSIDPSRTVLVGLDTGADHPFGATKMVVTEKGLVLVGEYLERHRSFLEHAQAIKGMVGQANIKYAINKNERQPMIELAQPPNMIYCQPANNDQMAGIERVKVWLHNKQMWFVASRVPRTIQQMKSYRYAENTATDGQKRKEQVYKKDDELPDCVRYSTMIWPQLPKKIEEGPPERDFSHLSAEARWSVERIRRIEKNHEKEPEAVSDDFWATSI